MKDGIATNSLSAAFPRELAKNHEFYDPDVRLLRKARHSSSEDIEETSTVHSLRPSLSYAVALLDSSDPRYRGRAVGIIDQVLRHQEDDHVSPYCGCWPYYAEQSLSELSRVDLNWACFWGAN